MQTTMILAPSVLEGNKYADANGHSRLNVVTPLSANRVRGQRYSKLIVAGRPVLKPVQGMIIILAFFDSPHREDIVQRLRELVKHD